MSITEPPLKRWTWPKRVTVLVCVSMLIWGAFQLWPVWLEPGPKTTVITGPLRPDGTIDYAAALNKEFSAGVTPENNAAVLLLEALGPEIIDRSIRSEYFRQLGIEPPPAEGKYLQSLEQLFAQDPETLKRVNEEMDQAMTSPWSDADYPELAKWLAINEKPLKLCTEACRRERFYSPLIPPAGGWLLDSLLNLPQASRNISRLWAVRVTSHLHAGRIDEALNDAESIHRMGRLMSQHPMMIAQLIAHAHLAMGAASDAAIIHSGLLSAELARRQRERLSALPPYPPMVSIVDHGERFGALDSIQIAVLGPPLTRWTMDSNLMLTRINEAIDEMVTAMQVENVHAQFKAIEALEEEFEHRAEKTKGSITVTWILSGRRYAVSSSIADIHVALLAPTFQHAAVAQRRVEIRQSLILIGYALAEYRALHGEFPETLEALVPEIMEKVPTDPYADGPYRYVVDRDQNSILLYSVGENGVDDGGRMRGGQRANDVADDIAFGTVPDDE